MSAPTPEAPATDFNATQYSVSYRGYTSAVTFDGTAWTASGEPLNAFTTATNTYTPPPTFDTPEAARDFLVAATGAMADFVDAVRALLPARG